MTSSRIRCLILALLLLALSGLVAAQVIDLSPCIPVSSDVPSYSEFRYQIESPFTGSHGDAGVAVLDHLDNGTPLPPGVILLGIGPEVEARQTGVILKVASPPTTLVQYLLTVKEDTAEDLQEVRLSINNFLVQVATRANGKIIDGTEESIATITHFIDPCDISVAQVEVIDQAGERSCINLSQ